MASLSRVSRSPYWIACFTLPDGTRTNRSTRTSDRRLAQRLADEWQAAAEQARAGRFVETQARVVLNDILQRARQSLMPRESAAAYLRRWLAGKGRTSTARRYQSVVQAFLEHLGGRGDFPLDAITPEDVSSFLDRSKATGIAPRTLQLHARALGAAFNLGRKLGLVSANPVEHALALRPIVVESSRRACFTPAELRTLIEHATTEWKTVLLLGYYTGARLSDCANLRWAAVDLDQRVMIYTPQKTRRPIVVPLHSTLLAHLTVQPQSSDFVCPALAGRPTGGNRGLSAKFSALMRVAGLDAREIDGQGLRRFRQRSFHSLRLSFNSALANAGVDQETRMSLTGHRSPGVNAAYTHLELDRLVHAIAKLPAAA